MAAARIGKVRMKEGGTEVRVLQSQRTDPGDENYLGEVVKSARKIAEFSEPGSELCGFVVLGLYTDGAHSLGYRYDEVRCAIPAALLPSLVAELIRRDIVTKGQFNAMFERV